MPSLPHPGLYWICGNKEEEEEEEDDDDDDDDDKLNTNVLLT
jgi:hypothetical protein